MCEIALIISGVRIDLSSLLPDTSIYDIKAALRRRGPDSLGSKSIFLHTDDERTLQSSLEEEIEPIKEFNPVLNYTLYGKLIFVGATLQLRGVYPITQPLVDESGNILVYNGEVFGGIEVNSDSNETEILMRSFNKCCNCLSHKHEDTCGNGKYSVP
ncbi:hypothetical protein L2E82_22748 [Cichorium intybus]|uniref:Uncharacterized protein n=1 Tax=Cichorium intybus TaxID=13427 RepID=A0ACB9DYK8_CICIN|nr:hypothetical protein L2E82_22748 [Cichorium intybus]